MGITRLTAKESDIYASELQKWYIGKLKMWYIAPHIELWEGKNQAIHSR